MEEELILFDEPKLENKIVYCDKKINEIFNNIKIIYKLFGYDYSIMINNEDIRGKVNNNRINIYYNFKYFNEYKFEVKFIFKIEYNIFILNYIRINNAEINYSQFCNNKNEIINGLDELLKKNLKI